MQRRIASRASPLDERRERIEVGRGQGLLAECLDELVLDTDDLHVGDGLARSPGLEVVLLKRVDEVVLGRVPRLADRGRVAGRIDRVDLVLLLALADAGVLVGFELFDLVSCLTRTTRYEQRAWRTIVTTDNT